MLAAFAKQYDLLVERHPILKDDDVADAMYDSYVELVKAFRNDNFLFLAGNGGSAADCEHIVGELMKGFLLKRPLFVEEMSKYGTLGDKLQYGCRCVSLLSHYALNSAFANDVDPEMIFAQQLFVLSKPNDVFLGISTSGRSKNIENAFKVANEKRMKSILLTGKKGKHCNCSALADITIAVPEEETFKVQELHLPVYHCICAAIEEELFGN